MNDVAVAAPVESAPIEQVTPANVQDSNPIDGLQNQAQNGTPQQKVEAKKMLKQLKYKVDGQELSEDLPFEIPEEHAEYMAKQFSRSKAMDKTIANSRQLEDQVKQFVNALKGDTRATLAKMGIDPKEFAAAVIEDELEKAKLSPEQREKLELQNKLKELEAESKNKEEQFKRQQMEYHTQQEYERIDNQMTQALSKSDLPKSPYVVKKIADYMLMGSQHGIDLSAEDILPLVRQDVINDIQQMFAVMPHEVVENIIGKEFFNKVRKSNLAKAKTPQTPATAKAGIKDSTNNNQKSSEKPKTKQDMRDFFGF